MNCKTNKIPPPSETLGFWKLFDFFWDYGVGNQLNEEGDPQPWTVETLASALDSEPSMTSLGNWRSRKHLPRKEQLQRLCRLLFVEDPILRRAWSSALIKARRDEELLRKQKKQQAEPFATSVSNSLTAGAAVAINASEVHAGTADETDDTNGQSILQVLLICFVGLLSIMFSVGLSNNQAETVPEPSVHNIHFCLERDFSQQRLSCNAHQPHFPAGTQKVYVSFETGNIPYGIAFSRRWYRNGEKFLERNDFFDETWENYTWLFNQHGHDPGEYSMRVIIGDQVFTGQFTLGDF